MAVSWQGVGSYQVDMHRRGVVSYQVDCYGREWILARLIVMTGVDSCQVDCYGRK